jgi:hypothetical protein
MTLFEYANLAEIVASLGVIASLIFVAWEVRKNTAQTRLANYSSLVDRYNAVYSETDDIELANLVAKGRKSYRALSEGERISFGHYLEQVCIANESMLIFAQAHVHEREANLSLFRKHMRFHLGFKGSREWFDEFESQRGFPASFMQEIHKAID